MSADYETEHFRGFLHGESIWVADKEDDTWGMMIDRGMVAELQEMIRHLDDDGTEDDEQASD